MECKINIKNYDVIILGVTWLELSFDYDTMHSFEEKNKRHFISYGNGVKESRMYFDTEEEAKETFNKFWEEV